MVWRLATLALMASLGWYGRGDGRRAGADRGPGIHHLAQERPSHQRRRFWLRMGLSQAGIAPAGVHKEGTGHHHLLIDTELPPPGEPIPNNRNHLHFGGGQTEVRIELPPGRHTLQLILGDADHVPFEPSIVSQQITVIVP